MELNSVEKQLYKNNKLNLIHGENFTLLFEHSNFAYLREHYSIHSGKSREIENHNSNPGFVLSFWMRSIMNEKIIEIFHL